MWTVLLSLMLLAPQLTPFAPVKEAVSPVRIEKLTPDEQKRLAAAKAEVAQAERELKGTEDGINLNHHANTECGCYVASQGRDYDRVEYKGDSIVIHHI